MGAGGRLARFGGGGLIGAGIGGALAYFLAPASGETLRHRLNERLVRAKLAGREAEAATTAELARRFRAQVNDPAALTVAESAAHLKVADAINALRQVQASAPEAASIDRTALSSGS